MTWTHVPHTHCFKPFFEAAFKPHGSIWTCDRCGRRWMLDRTPDENGRRRTRWLDASPGVMALRMANEYRANLSKEPADVGRRELAAARLWLNHHVASVYADLGLERAS